MDRTLLFVVVFSWCLIAFSCAAGNSDDDNLTRDPSESAASSGAGGDSKASNGSGGSELQHRDGTVLVHLHLGGPGGSKGPSGFFKYEELGTVCKPVKLDGVWRCLPIVEALSCYYGNAQCDEPLLQLRRRSDPVVKPDYVWRDKCWVGDKVTAHHVLQEVGQAFYRSGDGSCGVVPSSTFDHWAFFALASDTIEAFPLMGELP